MFRRFSTDFALFSILLDGALVSLALYAAVPLRPLLNVLPFAVELQEPVAVPLLMYPVSSVIWVLVLLLFSVYDARKNLHAFDEVASVTLGSLLAGVSLAGVLYLSYRDVSRVQFLAFLVLGLTFLLAWRAVARLAFRLNLFNAVDERRILIVGAGAVGRELQKRIEDCGSLGLRLVGFLDDDSQKSAHEGDILGGTAEAKAIVRREKINDVVLALPRRADDCLNSLMADLHDLPIHVWVVPDYFALALHRASVEEFAGIPLLDLRAPALTDFQRMIKRVFDVAITVTLMPIALPVLGLIALAIRLDSPGPIFFLQKRLGENGRVFEMWKFRTMVQNAEALRHLVERVDEQGRLIHKSSNDPRVTRVGRLLRRMSLDELPQLLNVLRGEMSLIGPRPELPYLVEKYEPWQRKRFAVPQGITGWWQVNGRSDKPMHLHTEDDLYYVQHYSLWLDLQILFKTVGVVLRGRGAY